MSDPSLYEQLNSTNIISRLTSSIKSGDLSINNETGKLDPSYTQVIDAPWIYKNISKSTQEVPCGINHQILFKQFKSDMGNPPSNCQSCWKVVVKPNRITELFMFQGREPEVDFLLL